MKIVLITYYVPKVLGAAMFYAKVGDSAILYTGDYNMTPDRHLGAAQVDRLDLDLIITEYGMHICVFVKIFICCFLIYLICKYMYRYILPVC